MRREGEANVCEIHADNADTVLAFCAMRTQWRVIAGLGSVAYQGIDYAAIPAVLALLRIPRGDRAGVFDGIRHMEQAALPLLNAKRKDD